MIEQTLRPWLTTQEAQRVESITRLFDGLAPQEATGQIQAAARRGEQRYDRESVVLYAGTNVMDPKAQALLCSGLGSRPSLGDPGQKYETGLADAEIIETACLTHARELFDATYVEYRLASGSQANLYAFMALAQPGDTILALPEFAAGHATHREFGAAGLYGLRVVDIPWDAERMQVDVDGLEQVARKERPRIILLGGSLMLFPPPVREARRIADDVGAILMYDAAHVSALITTPANAMFQSPLEEGAHVVTLSTYKSLGGPPGGLLLTREAEIAERVERVVYPGLTANFDVARVAALVMTLVGFKLYGEAYVRSMLANGQALARSLADHGLPVVMSEEGYTATHHVAMEAAAFGGGGHAARTLERCGIHSSGIGLPGERVEGDYNGLRFGVQEVSRWGMERDQMAIIAGLIADRLLNRRPVDAIWRDVQALRRDFQQIRYALG